LIVPLAVLAAACGGSNDNNNAGQNGDGGGGAGSSDTTPNLVKQAANPPKAGGKLVMGLEAETDGWDPTQNRWANSGTQVALAVFDPLARLDKDLKPRPYLAESFTPNADFKQWDVKLRANIKFHNGEELNAAAVEKFFTMFKASPLTGAAARPIDKVEILDPLTLRVHMKQAWSTFPAFLTAQGGVVPAPKQLDDKEQGPRHPIGTGPFVFQQWVPDKSFTVSKNADYWYKGYPLLESVEFRPIPDTGTRYSALKASDIDLMITSREDTIRKMLEDAKNGEVQVTRSTGDNDVNMILINTTAPPFDDLRVRQAVAYGVDKPSLFDITETDPALDADSVYTKDSIWYAKTDFPAYDPVKAKQLVDEYEKEKGPLKFVFGGTNDPEVIKAQQAIAEQWKTIGLDVDQQTFEQATFILNAVTGKYQIQVWRQFGASDPDVNYIWWHSDNAEGALALNMARNKDPKLDAALDAGRATQDVEARKKQYAIVQERQAADLPYIWLNHLRWTMAAENHVRGIENMPLPDGSTSAGLVSGVYAITGVWIDS
jgi:ABC-type transport system substrate-binding protein